MPNKSKNASKGHRWAHLKEGDSVLVAYFKGDQHGDLLSMKVVDTAKRWVKVDNGLKFGRGGYLWGNQPMYHEHLYQGWKLVVELPIKA